MSVDLLSVLNEIANIAISRSDIRKFVTDRMVGLLREVADVDVSQAEEDLRRAKNAEKKNDLVRSAAKELERAAKLYIKAYENDDKDEERTLSSLRAAILCNLLASMCYRAAKEDDFAIECITKARKVFYEYYVDALEHVYFRESLADGRKHHFGTGQFTSHKKEKRLIEGVDALKRISKEEKELIKFCEANGKPMRNRVCNYDLDVRESKEWGGGMPYDKVSITVSR